MSLNFQNTYVTLINITKVLNYMCSVFIKRDIDSHKCNPKKYTSFIILFRPFLHWGVYDGDFDFERLDNMVIIGYDIKYRLMDLFKMNKKLWLSIFNIDRISHCKT